MLDNQYFISSESNVTRILY